MSSTNEELMDKINRLQTDYYSKNGKNVFFKKTQKKECANEIANTFSTEHLINHTVYNITGTNKIYIDYTMFKVYATKDNYLEIIKRILELFKEAIDNYGNFEAHINLNSFTISSYERYKEIIPQFCKKCFNDPTRFSLLLSNIYIYHTPSIFDNISKICSGFMNENVGHRITLFNKSQSEALINNLKANM